MTQLTDRLERDLREIASGARPSPSAWESIATRLGDDAEPEVELLLAPASDRSRRAVRLALVAALVVIAGTITVLSRAGDDHSTAPAGPDATTFVSPTNGYSVDYPPTGAVSITPATQVGGFDVLHTGSGAVFKGMSQDWNLGGEMSVEHFVDEFVLPDGCDPTQQQEITIDGRSGRIAPCPHQIVATVLDRQRLYQFRLRQDDGDPRAVFDAFAATIRLSPDTAVDLPTLPDTFVSPTYGYTMATIDRGGIAPATQRWDPVNQPFGHDNFDDRFDFVETGYALGFNGASTPIPDGVSIDDWVDEYVTPTRVGGCGVPRSQQEEITIDGHPGRVAQCQEQGVEHIEATVVAGGRLYLLILGADRTDAREIFDTWIPTIDLTPETATVP